MVDLMRKCPREKVLPTYSCSSPLRSNARTVTLAGRITKPTSSGSERHPSSTRCCPSACMISGLISPKVLLQHRSPQRAAARPPAEPPVLRPALRTLSAPYRPKRSVICLLILVTGREVFLSLGLSFKGWFLLPYDSSVKPY